MAAAIHASESPRRARRLGRVRPVFTTSTRRMGGGGNTAAAPPQIVRSRSAGTRQRTLAHQLAVRPKVILMADQAVSNLGAAQSVRDDGLQVAQAFLEGWMEGLRCATGRSAPDRIEEIVRLTLEVTPRR